MIYLDSNVLLKLVRAEDETDALQDWLDHRAGQPMLSSELACAEVVRVVRRNNHTAHGHLVDAERLDLELAEAATVLASIELMTLSRHLIVAAGAYEAPMLRTLDAIHLVSALSMPPDEGDVRRLVTYDKRLAAVARQAGLEVTAPA